MTTAVNSVQIKPQVLDTDQKSDNKKINKKLEKAEQALSALKDLPKAESNSRLSQIIADLVDMLSTLSKGKIAKRPKNKNPGSKKAESKAAEPKAVKPKTAEPVTAETKPAAEKTTQVAPLVSDASKPAVIETKSTNAPQATAATAAKDENFYTSINVVENANGTQSIYTEDGYIISTEGKEQAWIITSPDGKATRIWGDPHVVESDGDKWDFKNQSSFIFGKNKVTIETSPAGNGQTFTSKITVYNGDSRATIGGIDKDKPVFEILKQDGILDDAIRDDGDLFVLTKETKGDDKFVLIKDVGEKFDSKFESKVAVGEKQVFDKLLTDEQKKLLGRA